MVLAILFLIGCYFVGREVITHSARQIRSTRNHARQRATSRGGRYDRKQIARRAARQATLGYWAAELRHLFPHVRSGLSTGWNEHQALLLEMERDRSKRQFENETMARRLRAEIDAYLALRRKADGDPGEDKPSSDPPLPDGKTEGNGKPEPAAPPQPQPQTDPDCTCTIPPDGNPDHASIIDRNCPVHGLRPVPDAGTPPKNGDTPVSDLNYDQLIVLAEACEATAESAVNDTLLTMATGAGDELGAMLPNDSTTLSLVAEMAAAAKKVQDGGKELSDAAAAVKDRVEKTYGPVKEAKEASGERLPEPEFVES